MILYWSDDAREERVQSVTDMQSRDQKIQSDYVQTLQRLFWSFSRLRVETSYDCTLFNSAAGADDDGVMMTMAQYK